MVKKVEMFGFLFFIQEASFCGTKNSCWNCITIRGYRGRMSKAPDVGN